MATNNNAHSLDSAGQPAVDFVWGNLPLQPNDVRTEASASNFGGTNGSDPVTVNGNDEMRSVPGEGADIAWAATTKVAGARLDFAGTSAYSGSNVISNVTVKSANHELEETAYASYPAYTPDAANYMVTAASGDGTTVSYTALNWLQPGNSVNITGLTVSALNLSNATVATANRLGFTVTNSATGSVTGANGKVQPTNAVTGFDGAYVSGVAYIDVPAVVGLTTALAQDALKDAGYAAANITTASGATNTATQPTRINVTATDTATVYITGGTGTWPVNTKVTIASGTGIPAALVGTWTVTGGNSTTLVISGSGWTVADTGSITPGTALTGTSGTIKTQSTAAGAASQSLSATITITPWA